MWMRPGTWVKLNSRERRPFMVLSMSLLPTSTPRAPGVPVIIYNPLSWERSEPVVVEAQMPAAVQHVEIQDASGKPLLSQVISTDAATHRIKLRVLAAKVPALGYKVLRVVSSTNTAPIVSPLKASTTML